MTFPVGETTIYYYAPFIWSNGGDFVSEDGLTTKDIFDSDTNAETLNYFKTLNEKGIYVFRSHFEPVRKRTRRIQV